MRELDQIATELKKGVAVEPITVRTFLSWFSAQRRGFWVVKRIRGKLAELGLETVPDFEDQWVDRLISIRLTSADESAEGVEEHVPEQSTSQSTIEPEVTRWVGRDASHRLSKLAAANQPIVSVSPDASLKEAVTLMMARDFSQLPVMVGARNVKGLISWKSVGKSLALGKQIGLVREFMISHHEVRADISIFEAIPIIIANEYVLVRDSENKISGIVTAADLSLQFQLLSEPFLLLSEIENILRNLIGAKFNPADLVAARDPADAIREINDVADLTFGEYVSLLQSPQRWEKLGLAIDGALFCADLDRIRKIRNNVTHFDPDGITLQELEQLRDFKAFLKEIESLFGVVS